MANNNDLKFFLRLCILVDNFNVEIKEGEHVFRLGYWLLFRIRRLGYGIKISDD